MFYIIATIIIAIASIIATVVICMQEGKSAGLSSSISGGSDTYWSRNKGRSTEGRLEKITVIASIVFLVLALLLNVGALNGNKAKSPKVDQSTVNELESDLQDAIDEAAEGETAE